MNSKEEFIEYVRPKIETKKLRVPFMLNYVSAQPMVTKIASSWLRVISLISVELLIFLQIREK